MPKLFTGRHAVLLGTTVIEPGQELPPDADKDEVKRLEAEGQITDIKPIKIIKQQEEAS